MQEKWETWVQSLDGEDLLKWQPISVFLPGKFHGQRSLAGSTRLQRVGHDWAHMDISVGFQGFWSSGSHMLWTLWKGCSTETLNEPSPTSSARNQNVYVCVCVCVCVCTHAHLSLKHMKVAFSSFWSFFTLPGGFGLCSGIFLKVCGRAIFLAAALPKFISSVLSPAITVYQIL